MKILHFIIDGYSPYNSVDILDGKLKTPEDYNKIVVHTSTDKSEHLRSPSMWFRYYSRRYIKRLPDDTRLITKMYDDVNGEDLIWRKLASKGVPSFCMPYNDLASKSTEWLVGSDESSKLLNGIYKKWYSKVRWTLTSGKFTRENTDHIMSALMAAIPRDCKLTDKDILDKLEYMNSASTGEDLALRFLEISSELNSKETEVITPKLRGNAEEYDNTLSELLKFTSEYEETDSYVHLGIGETDAMYHHRVYQTDNIKVMSDVLLNYISTARMIYNPDIIIISGDHNMVDLDQCEEYSKSFTNPSKHRRPADYVSLSVGKLYNPPSRFTISKSMNHPLPIFLEHGYDIDATIFYKDSGSEFVEELNNRCSTSVGVSPDDDLLPEHLYDVLLKYLGGLS